jgi:hypothetical protein
MFIRLVAALLFCLPLSIYINAQTEIGAADAKTVYEAIKAFDLKGGAAEVSNLVLKRDRVIMTFSGTFYFAAPVGGRMTGAVFIGQGTFRADVPPSDFEKNNVRRFLKEDLVESDFKTAVFKFTDDTFDVVGQNKRDGSVPDLAQKAASEINERILKETGSNISSRLAISLLNDEKPGVFFASYEGGKRGRFSYIFDPQSRIPTAVFEINAGEKGVIFTYRSDFYSNEIWMAFCSEEDYGRGTATYSDTNDLVDITNYDMNIDLRTPKSKLGLKTKIDMLTRSASVRAIPFAIGENLGEDESQRLKKQMRLRSARSGIADLTFTQEDWEGGFTVFLPKTGDAGQALELTFELDGDFMRQPDYIYMADCHYPLSNESWYPRGTVILTGRLISSLLPTRKS